MLLAIDVGNTKIKTAVFEEDSLVEKFVFDKQEVVENFKKIFKKYPKINGAISSSVAKLDELVVLLIESKCDFLQINHEFLFPFLNKYATPETLGVDRSVLMSGGALLYSNKNILVIDAGTCITYDFLSRDKEYFGGAISPGLNMRYKALNTFTEKLPLLESRSPEQIIGNSTNESIYSGVVNGLLFEIEGFISQYSHQFQDLTVILTGGDAEFLAKSVKSTIFAHSNFLLESLNALYQYHKTKKC